MKFISQLSVSDLTCCRDEQMLFARLSFALNDGEILHVLGPNGIGKSSLLRIISGLLVPTAGEVYWQGNPISANLETYHHQISYLGHRLGIKRELTVVENLRDNFKKKFSNTDISQILTQFQLDNFTTTLCRKLSAGQQQRLALAKLILTKSKLWILDEPLTAMDKNGGEILHNCLVEHVAQEGMIIITSHQTMDFKNLKVQYLQLGNYVE